jgi:formylglycine-generating enzyme required for sulfatase activity
MQDWYHATYAGAPSNGRAWDLPAGEMHSVRGGSWYGMDVYLRASYRDGDPGYAPDDMSFRLAKDR